MVNRVVPLVATMIQAKKGPVPTLKVHAEVSKGSFGNFRFDKPFRIGRLKDCELSIDNSFVSRAHAEVVFEDGEWSIRDLGSANGLFVRGVRVPSVPIAGPTAVRLGIEGPELTFEVEKVQPEPAAPKTIRTKDPALAHYIDHYFSNTGTDQPAGEHTMFIRQAFAHVETKRKKKFGAVIAALLAIILAGGLLAYHEHRQLLQQRATAEELFYAIKTQDIDLANLDRALTSTNSQAGVAELSKLRAR
jgi:membrane-bound lytic murein transglycosylase D